MTWAKVVFDGTEAWQIGGSGEGFWHAENDMAKLSDYSSAILCDSLKTYPLNSNTDYKNATEGITGYAPGGYPNQNWVYAKGGGATGATAFKAWLAENPITVVYTLATPILFHCDPASLTLLKGQNWCWAEMIPE